jgi:hypothetical protein
VALHGHVRHASANGRCSNEQAPMPLQWLAEKPGNARERLHRIV